MPVKVNRIWFRAVSAVGEKIVDDRRCTINASKNPDAWSYRVVLIDRIDGVDVVASQATEGTFLVALVGMSKNERARKFIPLLDEVRGKVRERIDVGRFFSDVELSCLVNLMKGPCSAESLCGSTGHEREDIYQAIARLHDAGIVLKEHDDFRVDEENDVLGFLRKDRRFRKMLKTS